MFYKRKKKKLKNSIKIRKNWKLNKIETIIVFKSK